MDYFSLIVGILAIAYGIYSYVSRVKNPKNKPVFFQHRMSEKKGMIIHLVFYTIIPIILGIALIVVEVLVSRGK